MSHCSGPAAWRRAGYACFAIDIRHAALGAVSDRHREAAFIMGHAYRGDPPDICPWRLASTATPILALILAEILDALLRALVFAPRPSADLVAVVSPSASSGFPTTFGLVYGALFGAAVCTASNRNIATAAASTIALFLIAAGVIARVVLGGYWFSQIMASTLYRIRSRSGGPDRHGYVDDGLSGKNAK